ncbi:MAG: hypothetical protein ACK5II_00695 [Paracoccus sp. (in: a-proteobacteria)]
MIPEQQVLQKIKALCAKPGYIHALAAVVIESVTFLYDSHVGFRGSDIADASERDWLNKNEINVLVGYWVQTDRDRTPLNQETISDYAGQTKKLMAQLHDCMKDAIMQRFDLKKIQNENFNPLMTDEAIREAVFYSAESAYTSQYRDFSAKRYSRDAAWMQAQFGFDIYEAVELFRLIQSLRTGLISAFLNVKRMESNSELSPLTGLLLPLDLIIENSSFDGEKVNKIIDKFTLRFSEKNTEFRSLSDTNLAAVFPFFELGNGALVCFQEVSLFEALYDNPMYWIGQDDKYKGEGLNNRGGLLRRYIAPFFRAVIQ